MNFFRASPSTKCRSHSNRQPSLSTLIASSRFSASISKSRPLIRAEMPVPSCCWTLSTLLSRALEVSERADAISGFKVGALSKEQFSGIKCSFTILSLSSLLTP